MAAMLDDPGRIPVLGVEAEAPESSGFSWKQFYRNALEALSEPFIDQKISYQTTAYVDSAGKTTPLRKRQTVTTWNHPAVRGKIPPECYEGDFGYDQNTISRVEQAVGGTGGRLQSQWADRSSMVCSP